MLFRDGDDPVAIEIGVELDGIGGAEGMLRVGVYVGVDGGALDTQRLGSPADAESDLATVGYEDGGKGGGRGMRLGGGDGGVASCCCMGETRGKLAKASGK